MCLASVIARDGIVYVYHDSLQVRICGAALWYLCLSLHLALPVQL
jgi:hypothetical protein